MRPKEVVSHKTWNAGQVHPNGQIRGLAWGWCLASYCFTDRDTKAWGKDLPLATQLSPDLTLKVWALGLDGLALCASQFSHL